MDVTLLGNWSPQVGYQVDTLDSNTNGIPDSWEIQYFGSLARTGSGDFDDDGISDYAEYIADTNPTNAASLLQITGRSFVPAGLKIDRQGGTWATQQLQRIIGLGDTNGWSNIFIATPRTPTSGSYADAVSTNVMQFYRIKATR